MTWANRVAFTPDGTLAYRPGEVIVRGNDRAAAEKVLRRRHGWNRRTRAAKSGSGPLLNGAFIRFAGVPDPLSAVADLLRSEIYAQVNHVLFATPFYANPFYANPFYANPFYANPFYANPFYANPFYANPFYANPFYANASAARYPGFDPEMGAQGVRMSSVQWADNPRPGETGSKTAGTPRIVIMDTDYARSDLAPGFRPAGLPSPSSADIPDTDPPGQDGHRLLDPAAGHATFIAGIIEQIAPGCTIEIHQVIQPYGDGDEAAIATKLGALALNPPDLVNLSFGGYTSLKMDLLATAVKRLHDAGTTIVASAGNDGTWVPMYPAAFEEVIGVAALAPDGTGAHFTNYGPWVSACTYGVDIVSTFFKGKHHISEEEKDVDFGEGWAKWSGTSFAAPRAVAVLARYMQTTGSSSHKAVRDLISGPAPDRHQFLGARIPDPQDFTPPAAT